MPQGITVFDSSGNTWLDTSTITLKSLTIQGDVSSAGSVSISVPAGTTPVVSVTATNGNYPPVTSLSGSTLSWSAQAGAGGFNGRISVDLV